MMKNRLQYILGPRYNFFLDLKINTLEKLKHLHVEKVWDCLLFFLLSDLFLPISVPAVHRTNEYIGFQSVGLTRYRCMIIFKWCSF